MLIQTYCHIATVSTRSGYVGVHENERFTNGNCGTNPGFTRRSAWRPKPNFPMPETKTLAFAYRIRNRRFGCWLS